MEYEVFFPQPWQAGAVNGLLHLEHINVCAPSQEPVKQFYFDALGFAPDPRRVHNIDKGSGTIWANIGTSQIHLPEGESQVVPGTVGVVYPDLIEVVSRLKEGRHDVLEGTKFAWKEDNYGTVHVTCPYGNKYHLHTRTNSMATPDFGEPNHQGGPRLLLDPRGGRLPGPSALGLGIAYVDFRVKRGTAPGIGRFYQEVFGSEVRLIDPEECAAIGDQLGRAASGGRLAQEARAGVVVRVGPAQHLGFWEPAAGEEDVLPEYDGHHICVYLSDEGFRRSFKEAERRGIVFINPRPNYGKADTLERAVDEQQYRVKDMIDPISGERLHELEHEIRSVSHPSYPVAKDLSLE